MINFLLLVYELYEGQTEEDAQQCENRIISYCETHNDYACQDIQASIFHSDLHVQTRQCDYANVEESPCYFDEAKSVCLWYQFCCLS